MPYSTGTAATPTALKSAIESFAAANGWTLAGGVLSEGICHVKLTAQDTAVTTTDGVSVLQLKIEGANNSAFSSGVCGRAAKVMVPPASWPVTYFLQAHSSPANIFCIVKFGGNIYLHLAFGTITKHGSTIIGGNWFSASHNANYYTIAWTPEESGYTWNGAQYGYSPGALFWYPHILSLASNGGEPSSMLHYEMDSRLWWEHAGALEGMASAPGFLKPLHLNQPNAWNGQAILLPLLLFVPRASTMITLTGEVPHCRATRIDNYNPEDVLIIGLDKWKVFPWYKKTTRTVWQNATGLNDSGGHGLAIKYDGP